MGNVENIGRGLTVGRRCGTRMVLLLAFAVGATHCGKSSSNPGTPGAAGDGGGAEGDSMPAAGEASDGGRAGEHAGGGGVDEAGGGGAAGAGGQAALTCEADEVKLRLVSYGAAAEDQVVLEYDAAGLLERAFSDGWYSYGYDAQGRIDFLAHEERDGAGYAITYESDRVRYVDDDQQASGWELDGRRWLKTLQYTLGGAVARTDTATWEDGLITQVSTEGSLEKVVTYSYDVDDAGRPVRMVAVGEPAPLTEEVYDAAGHHVLQVTRDGVGKPISVRLYRDNTAPVRSLLAAVYPTDLASNVWLWASFDATGDTGVIGNRAAAPGDLMPWRPLSLDASEALDFAVDLDGDEQTDVAGDYTFDDEGRLSSFALELAGEPRVTVQMAYTPELVTETIEYPGSERPAEERTYHYGCDDFEAPKP